MKLFKIPVLVIVFCASTTSLLAQKQNNVWYFGERAGLDFNTSSPTPISSSLITLEGTASFCDEFGNLLFYTNGATVWDRSHNVMPNGSNLDGGESSTQAALILPAPGSCNLFYVFTTEDHFTNGGLHYSVVDICLNDGKGDIVNGQKGILLQDQTAEKLTAVPHQNGRDIWILSHKLGSNEFVAFLLTSSGINTIPVISATGSVHPLNAHIGPIKASHDGKKIVCSASFRNICEMFDFDNATGMVSNAFDLLPLFPNETFIYGAEFSPDNKLLYLSSFYVICYLYQLDLSNNVITLLNEVEGNYEFGGLALGPDQKIYMARNQSDAIDIIDKPNVPGIECHYLQKAQPLAAGTRSLSGLPNPSPYPFLNPKVPEVKFGNDTIVCDGDTLLLFPKHTLNCTVQYQYSNGTSGHYLAVTEPGVYWVEGQTACNSYRDTIEVKFTKCQGACVDTLFVEVNKTICEGQAYEGYTQTGVYQDHFLSRQGCDSVRVLTLIVVVPVDLVMRDTSMCKGGKVKIKAPLHGMIYQWSTGETAPSITIDKPGFYWLNVNNSCSSDLDTFRVFEIAAPNTLVPDTTFCEGETILISLNPAFGTFVWSNGTSGPTLEIEKEGTYWVELFNECYVFKEYFDADQLDIPVVELDEVEICEGESYLLNAFDPTATYEWSTSSNQPSIHVDSPGDYWVIVSNDCGSDTANINVLVVDCTFFIHVPNAFSPNADGINDVILPSIHGRMQSYRFLIFDRWGNCVFSSKDKEETWDGYHQEDPCSPGVYTYALECITVSGEKKILTGDITLIR